MRALQVGTSFAATVLRAGSAISVGTLGARPAKPLELYEFEACPYCRKAREALTILDLDAKIFPCPAGGTTFRKQVRQRGGKEQFPYLVDPNTGAEMYESDEIVGYLFARYGNGSVPWILSLPVVTDLSSTFASLARATAGRSYRAAKMPAQPLELWSFEASPYCRLARERLCELEIPYILHNVAKGSPKREEFIRRSGKMMVPYLVDPNTGAEMFESGDIVAYLETMYAS